MDQIQTRAKSFGLLAKRHHATVAAAAKFDALEDKYDAIASTAQQAFDRAQQGYTRAHEREPELRTRMIRWILERHPTSEISHSRWCHDPTPLASHREGGKLYLVVANPTKDWPTGPGELVVRCILVILDDPTGGAA